MILNLKSKMKCSFVEKTILFWGFVNWLINPFITNSPVKTNIDGTNKLLRSELRFMTFSHHVCGNDSMWSIENIQNYWENIFVEQDMENDLLVDDNLKEDVFAVRNIKCHLACCFDFETQIKMIKTVSKRWNSMTWWCDPKTVIFNGMPITIWNSMLLNIIHSFIQMRKSSLELIEFLSDFDTLRKVTSLCLWKLMYQWSLSMSDESTIHFQNALRLIVKDVLAAIQQDVQQTIYQVQKLRTEAIR